MPLHFYSSTGSRVEAAAKGAAKAAGTGKAAAKARSILQTKIASLVIPYGLELQVCEMLDLSECEVI